MKIEIENSRTGKPVFGVGGGAATNTFSGRFVVSPDGSLKPAIFIKKAGQLANRTDQAIVPLIEGDIIVSVYGHKPVDANNPDCHIEAVRIKSFNLAEKTAEVEKVGFDFSQIPQKVVDGLNIYHNRSGEYFVR
jgi:hypothetical protein